ncbi:MAG: AbrB/MazE/SpoVT family DNA-binding domain-containing protein [Candidatus Riflebacteria bacterium]|nr:AbrB/MazE/SpoVT family DNA-binding domain-containing protein [Candidatus Riflebacteria bacterium]
MKGKIQKWGNSLAIRIPKPFANEIHLENNSSVEISLKDGAIVVEPSADEIDFDDLLKKVNKSNLHKLIDFGPPCGKEII